MGAAVSARVVVMGVAGSGKSTVAAALAARLGARFVEADEFHQPASIAKMAAGVPLDDDDRWPWLLALREQLSSPAAVVLACSALRRSYRDLLRGAGGVRFVFLDVDRYDVVRRVAGRTGHFMGAAMVDGQFTALERPADDETDVVVVPGDGTPDDSVEVALAALDSLTSGPTVVPALLADGGVERVVSADELRAHVHALASAEIVGRGARRVLLVPPDHTRLHSRAGEITAELFEVLTGAGCEVAVLPALGTHAAMTPDDVALLFGGRVPASVVRRHRWRDGLVRLGEIGAAEVAAISHGRFTEPIPVEVDELLLDGWDLVVSIGQVVPHEVIGMANFTKNLVIGLGGAPTVHRSHFLGAVADMETIMGRVDGPVRHVVDAAFDRFVAPRVTVLWILTVMQDAPGGVVQRGLFAGTGRSTDSGGTAYRAAAALAVRTNVTVVDRPFDRVACWLDPDEFRTTWLGNKAIYRTRMAIADGGELIVLAPGVTRFGEDAFIDALIRRHGYRGTPATLAALGADAELAANLGAAAHLIHGSSEGRFTIVYCTDPAAGGLARDEVGAVGFAWRPLGAELARLGVGGSRTAAGPRVDRDGQPFEYIANPALGLWSTADRLR